MDFSAVLPWRWIKLDPARTKAARTHFDQTGHYDAGHKLCQSKASRHLSRVDSTLASKGMQVVRLLSSDEAAAAKQLLLSKAKDFSAAKKSIDYSDVLSFENTAFLSPVIEKMLNPEVDALVSGIFGSEYYVHSLVSNRTMPSKVSKRSFLWHCDRGPKNFLKINMFLDATSEHGGTTEFVDLTSSKRFEDAGYTFGANARRVSDLSSITRKIGGSAEVTHPQLDAGEAFIFYPSRSLHRGFLPTKGIRHMLSLVLLPSPVPWRTAWDRTVETGYHDKTMATFPANAHQLFNALGVRPPAGGLA
jgi:hypothetical protein